MASAGVFRARHVLCIAIFLVGGPPSALERSEALESAFQLFGILLSLLMGSSQLPPNLGHFRFSTQIVDPNFAVVRELTQIWGEF